MTRRFRFRREPFQVYSVGNRAGAIATVEQRGVGGGHEDHARESARSDTLKSSPPPVVAPIARARRPIADLTVEIESDVVFGEYIASITRHMRVLDLHQVKHVFGAHTG